MYGCPPRKLHTRTVGIFSLPSLEVFNPSSNLTILASCTNHGDFLTTIILDSTQWYCRIWIYFCLQVTVIAVLPFSCHSHEKRNIFKYDNHLVQDIFWHTAYNHNMNCCPVTHCCCISKHHGQQVTASDTCNRADFIPSPDGSSQLTECYAF
jgi:hypothetical protein